MGTGNVYGTPNVVETIYEQITRKAPDLRGRLRELVQLAHYTHDPAHVAEVRARLFADARPQGY